MANPTIAVSSPCEQVAHRAHPRVDLARSYFALALCNDYLSSGRGHQQSRRVLSDRRRRRQSALERDDDPVAVSGSAVGASPALASTADAERSYLSDLARLPRLTSGEEYCLAKRMKAGDAAARNALIESNLGLVVLLAKRYQRPGVALLDLVAEGNIGLMAATLRFDPEMGFRFATYAKWAVRHAVQQALPGLIGVVRLPARLTGRQRSEPDGEPDGMLTQCPDAAESAPAFLVPGWGEHTQASGGDAAATASAGFTSSDMNALDALAIPEDQEPPQTTQATQRSACLARALATLTERERSVVTERFALFDDEVPTLEVLSRRLGVSIERIRQIEAAAVRKLGVALRAAGESMDSLW